MNDYHVKECPPRLALKFLRWFCDARLLEDVEGDLMELYEMRAAVDKAKARRLFCIDVLLLFRPGIIRNFVLLRRLTTFGMLYHHIKTTLRQVRKFKGYTTINLSGLVVGLVSCLFIALWVLDEVNMDKFHEKSDRIYKVWRNMTQQGGEVITNRYIPQPLEIVLKNEYPEVEDVAMVTWEMESLFRKDDKTSYETGFYASPGFFKIFSFPFLAGNPLTALNDIHSVAISERLARSYFGDNWRDAVGQIFRIDERQEFTVTGIFANQGSNSSFRFDWIIPSSEFLQRNKWVESWYNGGSQIYFSLKQGADIEAVRKRAEQEVNKHTDGSADEPIYLQLFSETYLNETFENGIPIGGRIQYVRILTAVGLFILLIACINFMNLSTARSSTRAKEIGVRKVMGARRTSLSGQFFTESFFYALGSGLIAILIVYLTLPYFNTLTGKSIVMDLTDPLIAVGIIGIVIITGLLSGSYPALLMSSFGIINSLKGKAKHRSGEGQMRQVLATLQFAISIFLICGSIVVSKQVSYILNKDLGLRKENVMMVGLESELQRKNDAYRTELLRIPEVKNVTFTSGNPISYHSSTGGASWEGKDPNAVIEINVMSIGDDFYETTGIRVAEGKAFSGNLATDSLYFMVNEVLADLMGPGSPVGKKLSCWGINGTIIGLVRNFHMSSMYDQIAPLIIRYDPNNTRVALIRTQGSTQEAIGQVEQVTRKLNPAFPFRYQFMDEEYARSYSSELAVSTLLNYFALVCIFISCLGLLGLSSFAADQRAKEIGIRKVLGAGVLNLVLLISRDYVRIMVVACVLAIPVSYYYLQQWLNSFAFRMDLSIAFFSFAGMLAILLGGLTVGFKSFRAAVANPRDTLKEE
ncbi:MAG TPA: ABC transporter permease [Chryseolinea sp.]|nr:ABC transporter permease [Chryseolinea sp.]